MKTKTEKEKTRLIQEFGQARPGDSLEDLLLCMAYCVEEAMRNAGAIPGEDYKMLDLFHLGQPFALHVFANQKGEKNITFPAES